jgi:hypothetical protein
MKQRYILNHSVKGEKILNYAPEGWNDLKYTISRNQTYHGLFRSFSGTLRFTKDGKEYIDDVIDTYGFEDTIEITIKELNQTTFAYETKVNGVLNFDPETYVREENFTELNFEDSLVLKKMKNREDNKIAYNRKESIDGTILPGFTNEFVDVTMRGKGTDTATGTAVYPKEAFNRILQTICDLDYNPVKSSFLDRTLEGKASMVALSNGLLMRGADPAGDNISEGEANLNLSLKDLFENFNKAFNMGLGVEYDEDNQKYYFRIEDKNYFFQTTIILTVDNLSNLKYEYDPELIIQRIETGYQKFEEDNNYGLTEYNNASEFQTPVTISDRLLDLKSTYRADGTGMQVAIDNRLTASDEQEDTSIDEDVFFLHIFDDNGTLKTVQDENFDLIGGLYGSNTIQANIYLSPARNMTRWGDWIRSSLEKINDKNIRFNKAEKLSDLRSQTAEETTTIYENRDIAISDLKNPRLTGRVAKFEAPLTRTEINTITDSALGLVKFYDYIAKEYRFGWIKEVSTDRVDKDTTWELYEAQNIEITANNIIYQASEENILTNSGSPIILENS